MCMKNVRVRRAFGSTLRSLRTAKGLTQQELAEHLNCSTEYVSRMERGLCSPSFDMIAKICAGLMIHPRELFNFSSTLWP